MTNYPISISKNKVELNHATEDIWLNLIEIAELFGSNQQTVEPILNRVFDSYELEKTNHIKPIINREKIAIAYYDLDTIIAIGFKLDTPEALKFRQWANTSLKSFLKTGLILEKENFTKTKEINLDELQEIIELMHAKINLPQFEGHERDFLSIIQDYTETWEIMHKYDTQELQPKEYHYDKRYTLTYEDTLDLINQFHEHLQSGQIATETFGQEVEHKLQAVIGQINQSFEGKEIYESIEEKAANLLYLVIKDHPFSDGNKRIGAMLFVNYLERNNFIWKVNREKKINDNALASLALLVAASRPEEKETMVTLIIRLIQNDYVG